jgi:hypothetical protein
MPVKTIFESEHFLRNCRLPNHGKSYTVISHGTVIDEARARLSSAGFTITNELYKTTISGDVAQGIYHLKSGNDPDMGLMFVWSNSYNKTMAFKCAIGAQVFICMNGVVSGNLGSYRRRHSGSALSDLTTSMQEQIANASTYYDDLIKDKEMLKDITLTTRQKGSILGRLFAENEILTLTQVGIVKREIDKPSFSYSSNPDSAWDMYNHITLALKDSHPMSYLSDHQRVHSFFVNEFGNIVNNQSQPVTLEPEEQLVESSYFEEEEQPVFGVTFL